MEIQKIPLSEIKLYEKNPRKNDRAVDTVMKSIKEYGFLNPIILDKDNVIIAGHTRFKAAAKMALREVPVIWADQLTPEQVAGYRIMDNRSNENASWDMDLLKEELTMLKDSNFNLDLTGFSFAQLDKIVPTDLSDEKIDVNAYERAKSKTKIQRGEIYKLGSHILMCGDSTNEGDVKKLIGETQIDMIFTDPPYGIDYLGGRTQLMNDKPYGKIEEDKEEDISKYVQTILKYQPQNGDSFVSLSPVNLKPALNQYDNYDAVIVWKKQSPGLGFQWIRRYCEFLIFKSNRKKEKQEASEFDFWEIDTDNRVDYTHGTQKPVSLAARAIVFSTKTGGNVLDLFAGSGSTLIACEQKNRKCIAIEIEPVYCQVIIDRWERLTGRKAEKCQ